MAYETKVIIIALADIVRLSPDKKTIYNTLVKMAEAEGFKLEPFNDEDVSEHNDK